MAQPGAGLLEVLSALDAARVVAAFDGFFDRCTDFDETGRMVDALADQFPALRALLARLAERVGDELIDDHGCLVVLGASLALLGVVEHGQAERLHRQFPDLDRGDG